MFEAAAAVHVDDAFNVGKKPALDKSQEVLSQKFTYGSVEELPFRFLGQNYQQDKNGDLVIDTKHYVENI